MPGTRPGCPTTTPRRTLLPLPRSYGLMRQTIHLRWPMVSLAPAVFADCRQSLLTDGPSRYYPCTPCVGAWTHTPPFPMGALALFFPTDIGLASRETRSAKRNYPCPATSPGSCFSRLQSFATFRLLRSLDPRIAPTAPPRGSEQLGRLHHALPGQLPVSSCGIATCLI